MQVPLPESSMDVVISQEALLHGLTKSALYQRPIGY